ncbi:MAG: hypothetical protein WDN24_11770 [Sphingomonas sp.]
MTRSPAFSAAAILLAATCLAAPATAQGTGPANRTPSNRTIVGKASVERPTLHALGFDVPVAGDDNRNARVEISYRKKGETGWRKGMPLLRLQGEDINASGGGGAFPARDNGTMLARPPLYYKVPNMFSGSLLNLEPGTDYEARLVVSDPDGTRGATTQILAARTRSEPVPAAGGRVFHVYPWDYKGEKLQPAFTGLLAAYFMEARHADWANASPPRVRPGDTILVHAGVYRDNPEFYGDGVEGRTHARLATEFDGTYYLTVDGTPDKPIVIKGAGDGETIFDGSGNAVLFNLMAADYNYIEGLTIRNTNVGMLTGLKHTAGAVGLTIKGNRFENVGRGIQGDWSGAKDYFIADNVFIGRHDKERLLGWSGPVWSKFPGYPETINGPMGSEYAVKVYGQGHVVAYNHLEHFHDGIDIATYGDPDDAPDGTPDRMPLSNDIHNNDFTNMSDNCVEADGSARNVRVYENRCFNAASGAFSAQTIFGGPAYFFRNILYTGIGGSIKFSITPTGILSFNNTYIGDSNNTGLASNTHFRNNLFLSHGTGSGAGFGMATFTNYSTSDYNGFRASPANAEPFAWSSPPAGTLRDFVNRPVAKTFKSLADYQAGTGQDAHSVTVDYDAFVRASEPAGLADPQRLYKPEDYDLRLKPGSAPVDKGTEVPTVTDGFAGAAPDLGAYELGAEQPHYGPRN